MTQKYRNKSGLTGHSLASFNTLHDIQYPIELQRSCDMWGNIDYMQYCSIAQYACCYWINGILNIDISFTMYLLIVSLCSRDWYNNN